jgi:Xaa-Pro aminopeptidase
MYDRLREQIIEISEYATLSAFLQTLPADDRILISPQSGNIDILLSVSHMNVQESPGIIGLWKARKSNQAIEVLAECVVKDSVAVVKTLAWADSQIHAGATIDEYMVGLRLAENRQQINDYQGESFPAIVGSGPNGAIVHYTASPDNSGRVQAHELLLVDSGGQYLSGTTDSTRVIAFQPGSENQRKAYTLVLKGHIALSMAVFPEGTSGAQLDALARQALWRHGMNYGHGTGHGIGLYLNVHEGPQRISPLGHGVALEPGMLVSNEPGYYVPGHFGIRIENMLVVENHPTLSGFLCFRTLTQLPYEPLLIDSALLCSEERTWLDSYNSNLTKKLKSKVGKDALAWLLRCGHMPWQS